MIETERFSKRLSYRLLKLLTVLALIVTLCSSCGSGSSHEEDKPTVVFTLGNVVQYSSQNVHISKIAIGDLNEDGLNDELIFPGISAFPGTKLIIYNRWGGEVYRNANYKNNWKGKDDKERELQEDTYYYILQISNGRIIKGFIEIRR